MTIRIHPIDARPTPSLSGSRDAIHLIVAGYRSRPCPMTIANAGLSGDVFAVHWASGRWAEATASASVLARAARAGVPAMHAGRTLAGLGTLAGGVGGVAAVGAAQFRHRLWRASRDGAALPDALMTIPGIRTRPVVLHGHSLGTVVIRAALPGMRDRGMSVKNVLLMGGAAPRRGWESLVDCFEGQLINLFSPFDAVLNIAPILGRVVGTGPICDALPPTDAKLSNSLMNRIINHNIADRLPHRMKVLAHHSGYWSCFGEFAADLP